MLRIHLDSKNVEKGISGLRADMNWVMQNTINDLLKESQKVQTDYMRSAFTIRNEAFLKFSVRLQFATRSSQTGRIYIADLGGKNTSNIWERFEGGGIKSPTTSKNIAIPSTDAWSNRGRPRPEKNKPRNLTDSFVVKKGSREFIFARKGKKPKIDGSGRDRNIKLMYTLKDNVRIPDRLHFYRNIIPTIEKNYESTINKLLLVSLQKRGFK